MPSSRSRYLILACIALAILVWFDNQRSSTPGPAPSGTAPASDEKTAGDQSASSGGTVAPSSSAGRVRMENPLATLDKAELKDTVERPLFAPARRRPPPAKVAEHLPVQSDAPPPPSFDLLGVIRDGSREIALLRKKSDGTSYRVEVGDMIGGWRVSKMEATSILLERDGASQTVPLFQ